jgi:hypothetical protein
MSIHFARFHSNLFEECDLINIQFELANLSKETIGEEEEEDVSANS